MKAVALEARDVGNARRRGSGGRIFDVRFVVRRWVFEEEVTGLEGAAAGRLKCGQAIGYFGMQWEWQCWVDGLVYARIALG